MSQTVASGFTDIRCRKRYIPA